jgi:predicted phage terminase large subunit-like protein
VNDPMGRPMGAPLWPEWFEQARIDEFKRNPRDWISLFQQRPVDEKGTWCPPEHINITTEQPKKRHMKYMIGVDIALSIQTGDFTVFSVVGIDDERKLHLVELYRKQVSTDVSANEFLDLCQRYQPTRALIDDDNASKVWQRYVFDLGRQRGYLPPLDLRPMRGRDKETRAAPLRGYLLSDQVTILESDWSPLVYEEILNFPGKTAHDDIIDALSLVAREMTTTGAFSSPQPKKVDIPLGIIEKDGIPYLNTPLEDMAPLTAGRGSGISRIYSRW